MMNSSKNRMSKPVGKLFRMLLGITIVAAAATPVQLSGQSVQRLFSTPALRAELDRRQAL